MRSLTRVWRIGTACVLVVGAPCGGATAAADSAAWEKLTHLPGVKMISLSADDPIDGDSPYYYEEPDGWLQPASKHPAGDTSALRAFQRPEMGESMPEGVFPILRRVPGKGGSQGKLRGVRGRAPLALAVFAGIEKATGPLMARISVRAGPASTVKMNVLWAGEAVSTVDTTDEAESDRDFFVNLPRPQVPGQYELRLATGDYQVVLVRRIAILGAGVRQWKKKPPLPDGAALEVLSACYLPDPQPPAASQAVEGRHVEHMPADDSEKGDAVPIYSKMQRLYEEHAQFGGVRVVVRNSGTVPTRISDRLLLNGKPIEDSYVDFVASDWDARGVVWYRIRPRSLAPGQSGQIYIRFRRRPEGKDTTVTVNLLNGEPQDVRIAYDDPGMAIDYVTVGQSADDLYVYARRSAGAGPGNVVGLTLDGEPVANAKINGADFPGSVALIHARLPAPLESHSYHVVGVETSDTKVAAQFRVLPLFFPRSTYYNIEGPDLSKSLNMNLIGKDDIVPLEICEKYDFQAVDVLWLSFFDHHPRVAYTMFPDEPDAQDKVGGGYDRGLGWTARLFAEIRWGDLVQRFAATTATWVMVDHTTRPLNWSVYGQVCDVFATDPYSTYWFGADHAYVRESLNHARLCSAPARFYACLETTGGRPLPAEYRQNVVQAIGAGMKGLTSWWFRGIVNNEPLQAEVRRMNTLIEHIENDLLLGTPVDLAASDAGQVLTGREGTEIYPKPRVWVGSLLCGPDAIVVAVANHIEARGARRKQGWEKKRPEGAPTLPRLEPTRDVTITVELPGFLQNVAAFEATEQGVVPFAFEVKDGKAILKLNTIEVGRVFVLRRR